jgi:hypothetical protein
MVKKCLGIIITLALFSSAIYASTLTPIDYYPVARDIIKAEDVSQNNAIIQDNFDVLNSEKAELGSTNTFTGVNTFSGYLNLKSTTDGNVDNITITPSGTTTVVTNANVTANSYIFLFPTSANAVSVDWASIYISGKSAGVSFTITHPNSATTGRTFNYLILN